MLSGSSSCPSSSSCVRCWATPALHRQRPSRPNLRASVPLLQPHARGPRLPARGSFLLKALHRRPHPSTISLTLSPYSPTPVPLGNCGGRSETPY
ncbi:hypothetical protein J4Q44_G00063260 [Coregonus suidteri]|uniref:Uncharacterized protein n=1 Tax=Coregonus suidteri TaxID=861788 RepID=A0AAN8MC74_9TELE